MWLYIIIIVPGVIGCLQALEAIKVASLVGEPLSGRMLLFDALSARIRIVSYYYYYYYFIYLQLIGYIFTILKFR